MKVMGKLFGLEDEAVSFVLEDDVITLITETNFKSALLAPIQNFDFVYGETNTYRNIVLFDVVYRKTSSLSIAGWAISKSNVEPDDLKTFDAITFSGKCLDAFYSPQNAFKFEKNAEELWDNNEKSRALSRVTRDFTEYVKDFDVEIEGIKIHIKFNIYISYNLQRNVRSIGEATPLMQFEFEQSQDIGKLARLYLFAFDFMKFLSFRQNISFDKIYLKRLITEGRNAGKYDNSAEVYFLTVPDTSKYNLTEREVITIDDVGHNLPNLFQNICKRRVEGIVDDLYIPLNNADARRVSYSSFLSSALSFEGEYTRLYPNEKSEKDKIFEEIKKNVLENIRDQENKFVENTAKEFKRAKKVVGQIEELIENLDSSLEEKFNRALKRYANIIDEFIEEIEKLELGGTQKNNWGRILSNMRNHIGHGNPLPIDKKHVAVFRITKCLIYVLILKNSGLEDENIKAIIKKLF